MVITTFARRVPMLLLAAAGCRDGMAGFGSGARGHAVAEQTFAALAERHVEEVRNPKYDYARVQLARGALSPSRVFEDSAAWTTVAGPQRRLESSGGYTDGRYLIASRPGVAPPAKPADARHSTSLTRLSDREYRWDASVDYALGAVRPSDVAAAVSRLIASGEGRTERDIRADLAAHAARSSAVMGMLFSLDSVHPVLLTDGSTATTLTMTLHSDGLRGRFPAFADYVRKYLEPTRYRYLLADRSGTPYFEMAAKDRVITIRVRTQRGRMVSLAGPARPMPDSLQMSMDFSTKMKIFHVGFHDLVMEFVNQARDDQERAWTITARREPQWELPLVIGRLIRAPLRRPFAGDGSQFQVSIRAADGLPTVLGRQTRLYVQESGILNFLNSLTSTAVDDLSNTVERQENAWLRELFLALRDDSRGAIGP